MNKYDVEEILVLKINDEIVELENDYIDILLKNGGMIHKVFVCDVFKNGIRVREIDFSKESIFIPFNQIEEIAYAWALDNYDYANNIVKIFKKEELNE